MSKYRIVKKSFREWVAGSVVERYELQEFSGWFFKSWRVVKRIHPNSRAFYPLFLSGFTTLEEAQQFLNNILKPVPPEEVLK